MNDVKSLPPLNCMLQGCEMCWSSTKETLHTCQCIQSCSLHNINHGETNQWRDKVSTCSVHGNCSTHTVPNQYYRRCVWVIEGPYNVSNIPTQEQVRSWSNLKFAVNNMYFIPVNTPLFPAGRICCLGPCVDRNKVNIIYDDLHNTM